MAETEISNQLLVCNPDVTLREEDEDGGLLFNPDTNQIKVVNSTGLFIWKQLASATHSGQIEQALLVNFEDVPADAVHADLEQFLEELLKSGFIGQVVERK